ncbi:acyl carrier protein [Bacillus mexicanus]|uniref:acyl carrier protein n=1 Tax=Bacillus mexicanus TaxID=2834415 RepID=UPI003D1AB432
MGNIFEKLSELIVERMGVDKEQVTPEASFKEDLGADSLDVVEFIMELEDQFEIEVPDEDAEQLRTVADVVKYIEDKQ